LDSQQQPKPEPEQKPEPGLHSEPQLVPEATGEPPEKSEEAQPEAQPAEPEKEPEETIKPQPPLPTVTDSISNGILDAHLPLSAETTRPSIAHGTIDTPHSDLTSSKAILTTLCILVPLVLTFFVLETKQKEKQPCHTCTVVPFQSSVRWKRGGEC